MLYEILLQTFKMGTLLKCDCVSATVWLHHLKFNETPGEKVGEQHEDAAYYLE